MWGNTQVLKTKQETRMDTFSTNYCTPSELWIINKHIHATDVRFLRDVKRRMGRLRNSDITKEINVNSTQRKSKRTDETGLNIVIDYLSK